MIDDKTGVLCYRADSFSLSHMYEVPMPGWCGQPACICWLAQRVQHVGAACCSTLLAGIGPLLRRASQPKQPFIGGALHLDGRDGRQAGATDLGAAAFKVYVSRRQVDAQHAQHAQLAGIAALPLM